MDVHFVISHESANSLLLYFPDMETVFLSVLYGKSYFQSDNALWSLLANMSFKYMQVCGLGNK